MSERIRMNRILRLLTSLSISDKNVAMRGLPEYEANQNHHKDGKMINETLPTSRSLQEVVD